MRVGKKIKRNLAVSVYDKQEILKESTAKDVGSMVVHSSIYAS